MIHRTMAGQNWFKYVYKLLEVKYIWQPIFLDDFGCLCHCTMLVSCVLITYRKGAFIPTLHEICVGG